jgi:hypothetical protein
MSFAILQEWMGYVRLSYTLSHGIGGEGWNNKYLISGVWNSASPTSLNGLEQFPDAYKKIYFALGDGKMLEERKWTMGKQEKEYEKRKTEREKAPRIDMENLVKLFTDGIFSSGEETRVKEILRDIFGFLEKISTGEMSFGVYLDKIFPLKFFDGAMRQMDIFSALPGNVNGIVSNGNSDNSKKIDNLHAFLKKIGEGMGYSNGRNFHSILWNFLSSLKSTKDCFKKDQKNLGELALETLETEIAWTEILTLHWEGIKKYLEHLIDLINLRLKFGNAEDENQKNDLEKQYRQLLFGKFFELVKNYSQTIIEPFMGKLKAIMPRENFLTSNAENAIREAFANNPNPETLGHLIDLIKDDENKKLEIHNENDSIEYVNMVERFGENSKKNSDSEDPSGKKKVMQGAFPSGGDPKDLQSLLRGGFQYAEDESSTIFIQLRNDCNDRK